VNTYLVLLRGINAGGKNKVRIAALRQCLDTTIKLLELRQRMDAASAA
jgi:hypothetical protein